MIVEMISVDEPIRRDVSGLFNYGVAAIGRTDGDGAQGAVGLDSDIAILVSVDR